ncbi:MAG TPA: magnesium chelatase [Bacteroidia bacterium]|nr:magnesium chelatase [Bacteroidia bacterium]
MSKLLEIKTLGELKKSGIQHKTIKEELRQNLIKQLKEKQTVFEGIYGYEDTVIPDIERAILSKHNINLLGLRGQAKTRIARLMVNLLDEYIPVVFGSELNDDPLKPISKYAFDLIHEKGDETPITWLHRSERYSEKLATPDVSVADLIGDVDPIKAANLRLTYADERVIHFGIIPRSHRCIFVINELPDLQARIQVALFNILQEGDIQIRGFKLRLPLDIQFVFTANPEDYTNRGSIVTPLKDRIGSQILTHYPKDVKMAAHITANEAKRNQTEAQVLVPSIAAELLEQIGFEARASEYVDAKSGVSARLSISAYENLLSTAERRCIINGDKNTTVRVSDFNGIIPAITGKVELVYEGEQEGSWIVANHLISKAIRTTFPKYFPSPEKTKKKDSADQVYSYILSWFADGNSIDLFFDMNNNNYKMALDGVNGLKSLAKETYPKASQEEIYFLMEFILHALSEYSKLNKGLLERGNRFGDMFNAVFGNSNS